MRNSALVFATLIAFSMPSLALAQDTPPPADLDPLIAIERMRADFRARFLDYDRRLAELTERLEVLEAERDVRARFDDMQFDQSAATMPSSDGEDAADSVQPLEPQDEATNAPAAPSGDTDTSRE